MRDKFGEFEIISGHEGSGKCWWCGGEFPDNKHRRYCSEQCSKEYYRHYWWAGAVRWALERAGHKCELCGAEDTISPYSRNAYSNLEVHHREPLNNEKRFVNAKNRPENLIVLCRSCHGKTRTKPKKTLREIAELKGQLVMDLK